MEFASLFYYASLIYLEDIVAKDDTDDNAFVTFCIDDEVVAAMAEVDCILVEVSTNSVCFEVKDKVVKKEGASVGIDFLLAVVKTKCICLEVIGKVL